MKDRDGKDFTVGDAVLVPCVVTGVSQTLDVPVIVLKTLPCPDAREKELILSPRQVVRAGAG